MDGTAIAIAAYNTSDVRQKRQHNHTQFFNNSSTDFTENRKMAQLCDKGQIENIKEAVNRVFTLHANATGQITPCGTLTSLH